MNDRSSNTGEETRQTSSEDSITPEFNVRIGRQEEDAQTNLGESSSTAAAGAAATDIDDGKDEEVVHFSALDVEALRELVLKQSQQISTLLQIINKTIPINSGRDRLEDNDSDATSSSAGYNDFLHFLASPSIISVGDAPTAAAVASSADSDEDNAQIENICEEESEVEPANIFSSPPRVMERPLSSPPKLAREELQKSKELSLASDRQEVVQLRLQQPAIFVEEGPGEDTTTSTPLPSSIPLDTALDSVERVALPVFTNTSPIKRRMDTTMQTPSKQLPVQQIREEDGTLTTAVVILDQQVEEDNIVPTPTLPLDGGSNQSEEGMVQIEDTSSEPTLSFIGELSVENIEEEEGRATADNTLLSDMEQTEDTSSGPLLVSSSAAGAVLEYTEEFHRGTADQTIEDIEQIEDKNWKWEEVDIDEESPRQGTLDDGQDGGGDGLEGEESSLGNIATNTKADEEESSKILIPHASIPEERRDASPEPSQQTFRFLIFFVCLVMVLSSIAIGVSRSATPTTIDNAEFVTSAPSSSPSSVPSASPSSFLPTMLPSFSQPPFTSLCSQKLSETFPGLELPLGYPSFVIIDLYGKNAVAVSRDGMTNTVYIVFYLLSDSGEWERNGVFIEELSDDFTVYSVFGSFLSSWGQLHCSEGSNVTFDASISLDLFTIYSPQWLGSCLVTPCPRDRGEEPI